MKFPKIKGCKLYLSGGQVRDTLMKRESNDKDYVIITKDSYDEVVKKIEGMGGVVFNIPNAREHLTIRCRIGTEVVDIAFPRKDGDYTDHRRADSVTRAETLKEDAGRRDFTINSMYMDENREIYDYHGGKWDIKSKIIDTVGDPDDRFGEDYLRMLRAVRFSIQLRFLIAARVHASILNNSHKLKEVTMERVKDELNKCLRLDFMKTMEYAKEYRLDEVIRHHKLNIISTNKRMGR